MIAASVAVWMTIICMIPDGKTMKEAWRIENPATLEHCLIMNKTFSGGGRFGSISVKCDIGQESY